MAPIDIHAIEQHARQLRAAEMRRIESVAAERARVYLRLLGGTLLSALKFISEILRPLFSWNPNHHHPC